MFIHPPPFSYTAPFSRARIASAIVRAHGAPVCVTLAVSIIAGVSTLVFGSEMALPLLRIAWLMWVLTLGSCVHEMAHALILASAPGVHSIHVEARLWRMSVRANGLCSRIRMGVSALAGPLAGLSVCAGAWLLYSSAVWLIVALPHLYALTPLAGDGRTLLMLICDYFRT